MATSLKNNNTVSQSSSPTSEIDDMTTYDALLQYTMSQNHNKTQGQGNDGGSSLDLASSSVSDSIDNSANSGMNLNLNLQDFFFLNRNIDSMLAAQQGTLEQQSADIVDIPGVGRSKVSRRNSLPLAADLSTMFDDSDEGSVLSDTDNKERSSGENNDLQRVLLNDIWENQKKLDQIDVDSSTVAARSFSSPNSNTSNNNVASFRKALAQQARENSKPKSKQVPIPSLTPIDMKIINKNNNDDEKKKKKISSTATTTKKKRSSLTPGQTLVKSRANKLVGAMKQTQQSQVEIHQWDKKMGLRRSHSKTMRNTTRSRKKLQKMFGRTFKPTQFERFNPSIALVGNIALATNDSREKTESDSSKQKHNLYAKCA